MHLPDDIAAQYQRDELARGVLKILRSRSMPRDV
jgi:hypothetical protein